MFIRNQDTGKWFNQVDTLSKDVYDDLKQDLEKVKLYSKCLSGSTYLPIDGFENIYNTFDIDKIGFYITQPNTQVRQPLNGPLIPLSSNNSNDFYNKYLKENAFTIKNLFTPNKLLRDQLNNYLLVDVATDAVISDLGEENPNYVIDGVRLKEGHRVLVRNQVTEISLAANIDPQTYFSTVEVVSNFYNISDNSTGTDFYWSNNENGIYEYKNNRLIKTNELDSYDIAYRYSIIPKLGSSNREKQFHLARLLNGYFPISSEGDNIEFVEKKNWVLRNRVDYNNIFDINYYDLLVHSTQSVFIEQEGRTYSIPQRAIAVGEFGVIINNQDKLSNSATYSQSHIISNKFKVNLRSIVQVENYYWCCGDEGTLLRISKQDLKVERINLGETNNFKSISFFSNLYAMIVGEFNTIWWTMDGGTIWSKLEIPEFNTYSYNSVIYYDLNKTFVVGDRGVFIEFSFVNGSWTAYKRKISKKFNDIDEYILFDDINDMLRTNWTKLIASSFSVNNSSLDFGESLVYENKAKNDYTVSPPTYRLEIDLSSSYFNNPLFLSSNFFASIRLTESDGTLIYQNSNFGNSFVPPGPSYLTWDFYNSTFNPPIGSTSILKKNVDLVLSSDVDYLLKNTDLLLTIELFYNFNGTNGLINPTYSFVTHSYVVNTKKDFLIVMGTNENNVITYDVNNFITKSENKFIYFSSTQSFSDVRNLSVAGPDLFVSGDKVYVLSLGNFENNDSEINVATGSATLGFDKYVNRVAFRYPSRFPYIAGNNSLLQTFNLSVGGFTDLDPSFNSKIKSKLLFLDYDVASKLNFFTDEGEYRLPSSVTFSQSSFNQSLVLGNLANEKNWLNYYKDAEKTFRYYSSISDLDKVEFSSTFSKVQRDAIYTINSNEISTNLNLIKNFAPTIDSTTFSRFIDQSIPLVSPLPTSIANSNLKLFLYKYLLIFKIDSDVNVGEVLRLTSNVIDCNLVINRIERYVYNQFFITGTGNPKVRLSTWPVTLGPNQVVDTYVYCYSEFNENIIRNLQIPNSNIQIVNLNRYANVNNLTQKFNLHPVSIAYSMSVLSNVVTISPRFNNKTAYYNLQTKVSLGLLDKEMKYKDSFLDFGYSPTYNILDYLVKIDNRFFPTYRFSTMPEFYALPSSNVFNDNVVYSDFTVGQISGTSSNYYRYGTNQIIFGQNLKFYWDALLIFTFVDLTARTQLYGSYTTEKLLISKKYYNTEIGGYVIEFNKKIEIDLIVSNNNAAWISFSFDIVSRNSLAQISSDLQTLNNIQRTSTQKSVQNLQNFTNLQSEISTKFYTDSYLKIFVSDYNIREFISAIIYTDDNYEIAMNLLNVEKEIEYTISNTFRFANGKLALSIPGQNELKVGDLINLSFNGGTFSSQYYNPQYFGLHTVVQSFNGSAYSYVVTSLDYDVSPVGIDTGTISFIKKDPFFNYVPVDLFELGSDKKVSRAIQIEPENYILRLNQYNLENVDLNKFRYELVDGLSLDDLTSKFSWVLEAEISNAIIGRDTNGGLIWYSGTWHCGRWFGGTWYSGKWISGDWYRGNWFSFNTTYKIISVLVDDEFNDNSASRWYNGRWFDGTWSGGTWYFGRRYAGDWIQGNWYNGIWNDGRWFDGNFQGGVWVLGTWEKGLFNCNAQPAYWLDGEFKSGDFENGIWYNGQFGNDKGLLSRFGTKSSNSRTSLWHAGKWIDGEFHSFLNINSVTGTPEISDIHKYSIWRTGIWLKGNFYGGIVYNIDFKFGNWHGGILEEIQVIGVDPILPSTASTNSITLNGIFKFNPGDTIWIIDDYRDGAFSPLGNNDNPIKYRINKIIEFSETKQTKVFLNYNLSSLGVSSLIATQSYSNVETGLRVVSYFKDAYWKSGLWTNGIFDGGQFDTGIWYNGVFNGTWGN